MRGNKGAWLREGKKGERLNKKKNSLSVQFELNKVQNKPEV